jgi:hypothetical protein
MAELFFNESAKGFVPSLPFTRMFRPYGLFSILLTLCRLGLAHNDATWGPMVPNPTKNPVMLLMTDESVFAYGDFNSDRSDDLFSVSSDGSAIHIYLWDTLTKEFILSQHASIALDDKTERLVALTPSDFTLDGRLDLLVSFYTSRHPETLSHRLYIGDGSRLGSAFRWRCFVV